MNQFKSELRKLLTVRTTYVSLAILVGIVTLIAFWAQGYKNPDLTSGTFQESITGIPNIIALFVSVVVILLTTNEYRFNTITYTLTTSKNRTRVFVSKTLLVILFASAITIAIHLLSFVLLILGSNLAGHPLPSQNINYLEFFAKSIFFVNGLALASFLIAIAVRNLIFTFAVIFVVPNLLESLLNLLLKENSIYLPFSALGEVIAPPPATLGDVGPFVFGDLSPGRGAFVYSIYLAIGFAISWYVFMRRDAN